MNSRYDNRMPLSAHGVACRTADADAIASVIDAIATRDYAIAPDFIDDATVAALRSRALALDEAGLFSPAAIGRGPGRAARADIRGDRVCWLDPSACDPAERSLFARLDALRLAVNGTLHLGLFELEGHYAIYPAGRGYARHVDRFRDEDSRVLSIVVYLNEEWHAEDGGALRLHRPRGRTLDVAPRSGTLAAFLSDRVAHEVIPATRPRISIAGWFRRRA